MTGSKGLFSINNNGISSLKHSRIFRWAFILIGLGAFLALAGSILTYVAEKKAEQEFRKVNGTFSSLNISLFGRSVTVKNLTWQSPSDSLPNKAKIGFIQLKGISLYNLIFRKKLYARTLSLDSGAVQFYQSPKKDSVQSPGDTAYSIEIENIILKNIFAAYKKDSVTEMEGFINLQFGALKVESTTKVLASLKSAFRYFEGNITGLKLNNLGEFYSAQVDTIQFNSKLQSLLMDSLKLIPKYAKYEFGKIFGKQVTRMNMAAKRVEIKGLDYPGLLDSLVSISKISIQNANLHAFRDKRIPFTNTKVIPMPMTSLIELPFALEIDSVAIDNATITVEEFAPDATIGSGYINFQKLNGLMVGLSNRYYHNKPQYAQLDATAMIMGDGKITASFRFPLDGSPIYSAKGKISNLSLETLNTMLENLVQVRIESGQLNELFFNFNYTDFKSNGTVEINYTNLKLTKLNSDREKSTDHLKTVLINAFLKKTKDESTEQRKRIGTIEAERDRHRFIFNFWWKSLQSGLKSSVMGTEKK